jgi:hypothetical protein
MAALLWWEMVTWIIVLLLTLLALCAVVGAARHSTQLREDQLLRGEPPGVKEGTMSRWSRMVTESHTSFWAHVGNRSGLKR